MNVLNILLVFTFLSFHGLSTFAMRSFAFVRSNIHVTLDGLPNNVPNATLNLTYTGTISNGLEDIYHYTLEKIQPSSRQAIRVSIKSNATKNTPVLFVARLMKGVVSWTVPFSTVEGATYNHVSRTLCPVLNKNPVTGEQTSFFLDISTASPSAVNYTLKAYEIQNYLLSDDRPVRIVVNPAEPMYYEYKFPPNVERVMVRVSSKNPICASVLVQNTQCPDSTRSKSEYTGLSATMTTQAAIVVTKKMVLSGSFYIVLLVKDTDIDCRINQGQINPFRPVDDRNNKLDSDLHIPSTIIVGQRSKDFELNIVDLPSNDNYVLPVLAPVMVFGLFYLVALIMLAVSWCRAEDGGRSFFAYLMPAKVEEKTEDDDDNEAEPLTTPSVEHRSYGSQSRDDDHPFERNISSINEPSDEDHVSNISADTRSLHEIHGYDLLDDIDRHKDIYRLKRNLYVSDLAKKSFKKLQKNFAIYHWNLLTIAIFYALPVVQLVLTYQRVVNSSGNEDICYYNFLCARPYHVLSAFNNVYSNIGYVMLGLLFVILVLRRDRLAKHKYAKDPENEKNYGIPKHYGILYAMGFALMMEGVLSACYHVCPNYSNFQFDTAFMYIIGLLGCLRLYQTRHNDVHMTAHFAYAIFAIVIFISVIGVVFRSVAFWAIFFCLHVLSCLYLSIHIYYMGRINAAFGKVFFLSRKDICSWPLFKDRFILLSLVNAVNLALAINGVVNVPKDFATYLLGIIVLNGLLYVVFYVIMKLRSKERINMLPLICIILSGITWGASLSFFIQGLSNWQLSPAQSREGNKPCVLLNFYDDHDIWHFLSAIAMFFTFLALMTLDDDVDKRKRNQIFVF